MPFQAFNVLSWMMAISGCIEVARVGKTALEISAAFHTAYTKEVGLTLVLLAMGWEAWSCSLEWAGNLPVGFVLELEEWMDGAFHLPLRTAAAQRSSEQQQESEADRMREHDEAFRQVTP
jgi:hypothetical protein